MPSESTNKSLSAVILVMAIVLSAVAATPALHAKKKSQDPPQVTHDGLELVRETEVAAAWVKPGADFSGYERIMLLEAYVAFRKDWQAEQNRTSIHKVGKRDIERMKGDMAELFREVFTEELDAKGGYSIVKEADLDVLLLRPAIIDLDVTAPDVKSGDRSYSFAASAGAATLYLELYDSVSSEILARAIDRKVAEQPGGFMRWANSVTNRAAAKKVLGEWANLLRQRLDEFHPDRPTQAPGS